MNKTVGILALQGDYSKHAEAVRTLSHKFKLVKNAEDLKGCDSLIIPGGESTTFMNLIDKLELRKSLKAFGKEKPVMGTCAGLIILADKANIKDFEPLKLIDIEVERNAYGRQINSFIDHIELKINGGPSDFEGVFIRAPKIVSIRKDVHPLAYHKNVVV
ncbi:MAG: pyridoxal 5'-phosphate synthase glutaminase subunit PdxT, partial [Calditrichaceae bacterium]